MMYNLPNPTHKKGLKMAGRRTCRHDMRCPHCGSNRMPKDVRSRGRQTCRCGDCEYHCAPDGNRRFYSSKVIDRALAMRAEGSSVAATGRAMEIKEGTVLRWVKKSVLSGWIMDAERSERKPAASGLPSSVRKIRGINADAPQAKTVSFDEMRTCLGVRRGENRQPAGGLRGWTQRHGYVPSAAAEGGEIQKRPL